MLQSPRRAGHSERPLRVQDWGPPQKSGVCAVGISASLPKKVGFSAQTASGQ
jgi:hypothetical protein